MPLSVPTWSQTKHTSKVGFDKVYGYVDKLGAPINRLSNKVGAEAFWPTTLDKESEKAARILRSFCKDGFYVQQDEEGSQSRESREGIPQDKTRVLKKIPTEVIKNAKGLAIFTTMRTGLWISGAGGSGILIARKADGEWSPPSGILLHTAGLGFLIGVDIYDCVVVINTEQALEAFTKIRCTLGGEVSATAGPVGMGGVLESEVVKRRAPVWNYLKSRGFYAGVQIDGTVIIQRQDENARFYGEKLEVNEILAGKVRHPPREIQGLLATLKAAQGDQIDEQLLPSAEPTPGDFEVHIDESKRFGLPPSEDDPDPFGVKALEEEGMIIKEITPTGEKSRPGIDAFEYKPSPSSPIFNAFTRENTFKRHSKRGSLDSGRLSISSVDRGTQTDGVLDSPRQAESPRGSGHQSPAKKTTEDLSEEPEDQDDSGSPEEDSSHHHEAVIIEKAKVITIPRRIPPPLPPRNPHRSSQLSTSVASPTTADRPTSPLAFEHVEATGLGITTDDSADISVMRGHSPKPSITSIIEERSSPYGDQKNEHGHEQERLQQQERGQADDNDGFEPIHLTKSQDAALTEELSHIPNSAASTFDRQTLSSSHLMEPPYLTSSSRKATDHSAEGITLHSGDRSGAASSNYSLAGSPPDTTPYAGASPVRLDGVEDEKVDGLAAAVHTAVALSVGKRASKGVESSATTAAAATTSTTGEAAEKAEGRQEESQKAEGKLDESRNVDNVKQEEVQEVEDGSPEVEREGDEFHSIPGSPTIMVAEARVVRVSQHQPKQDDRDTAKNQESKKATVEEGKDKEKEDDFS